MTRFASNIVNSTYLFVFSCLVALALTDLTPVRAQQSVSSGGVYQLRNQCSNKLLDVSGAGQQDGAQVTQWTPNNNTNQRWKAEATDSGYYRLIAQHSQKVLDVQFSNTTDGTIVWQYSSNNTNAQQWKVVDVGGGFYKLESRLQAGKVLDVSGSSTADGAKVQIWSDNGTCAQRWQLEAINAAPSAPTVLNGGFQGEYFHTMNFTDLRRTRTDPFIDFDFGDTDTPIHGFEQYHGDFYSIRWTGGIVPRYSEEYTFIATVNEGARLFINDQLIASHWPTGRHSAQNGDTEIRGTIRLQAGQTYNLKLEFYEEAYHAISRLEWQSASQTREVIGKPASVTPNVGTMPRMVFQHYMMCCSTVGNDLAGYKRDIQVAKDMGLDGFALNQMDNNGFGGLDNMYEAARQLDFKVFIAMDTATSANDPAYIVSAVQRYYNHPSQVKVNGRALLSTYSGVGNSYGYPSPEAGWYNTLIKPLNDAGTPVFFVPHFALPNFFIGTQTATGTISGMYNTFPFLDGLYDFAGQPDQVRISVPPIASMTTFARASKSRGKAFMAGVAAYAYTDRSYAGLQDGAGFEHLRRLWQAIVNERPEFIEMVTWNDGTEGTYMGPAPSERRNSPHLAFMELSKYYMNWYRTGQQPAITEDKLFYAYRTHSKNAVATEDSRQVAYGENAQDRLYVTAMLKEPGTVQLTTGGVTTNFGLAAGINDISVPFSQGQQSVKLIRNGTSVLQSLGAVKINNNIRRYNYNYYTNVVPNPHPMGVPFGKLSSVGDKCLEVEDGTATSNAQGRITTCQDNGKQEWRLEEGQLKNGNGQCLDVAYGNTADGARVQTVGCNGGNAQRWLFDGEQLKGIGEKCLDVANGNTADGTQVRLWSCNSSVAQRWRWR